MSGGDTPKGVERVHIAIKSYDQDNINQNVKRYTNVTIINILVVVIVKVVEALIVV